MAPAFGFVMRIFIKDFKKLSLVIGVCFVLASLGCSRNGQSDGQCTVDDGCNNAGVLK